MIEPDSKEDMMQRGLSEGEALLMVHEHNKMQDQEVVTADGDEMVAPEAPSIMDTAADTPEA